MTAGQLCLDRQEIVRRFWPDAMPHNFVGGVWTETPRRSACIDPSTGDSYTTAPETAAEQVADAVSAAMRAGRQWRQLTMSERIEHLDAVASALRENGSDLALLESIDSGNPLTSSRRDVDLSLRYLRHWPGLGVADSGRASQPFPDGISLVLYEPYGVVGKIIAFNHPILFALGGMIFPLIAGNTMVIKAAQQAPVATLALGKIIQAALPAGVVNIVSGGAPTGDALVTHPRVKRLAFTGSGRTALAVQARLSSSGLVKHFSAELGGKNAMVICPDVNLDAAVEAALAGLSFLVSQGQSCQSTSRLLVHHTVHDQFVELMAARLASITIGKAYEATTEMGPLISEAQLARVMAYVAGGVSDGGRIVAGGHRPAGVHNGGFYLEPTLLTGVTPTMRIAREEIFGPVATVTRWHDESEMLEIVNGVDLALSAAVWTRDIDRALRIAQRIDAGYIWVNDANRHYLGAPYGGFKASGVGREEAMEELASYRQPKSVNIRFV